jgi:hypothetical protein
VIDFIGRFDAPDERRLFPTRQMNLWLSQPALRPRYMQYVALAENMIAETLCRHRGTTPEHDDLAQLIAVAAIGATRVTMLTHTPDRKSQPPTKHLRETLDTLGRGLADRSAPRPRKPAKRAA